MGFTLFQLMRSYSWGRIFNYIDPHLLLHMLNKGVVGTYSNPGQFQSGDDKDHNIETLVLLCQVSLDRGRILMLSEMNMFDMFQISLDPVGLSPSTPPHAVNEITSVFFLRATFSRLNKLESHTLKPDVGIHWRICFIGCFTL